MFRVNHIHRPVSMIFQPISTAPAQEVDQSSSLDEGVPEFYSRKVTNIAAK